MVLALAFTFINLNGPMVPTNVNEGNGWINNGVPYWGIAAFVWKAKGFLKFAFTSGAIATSEDLLPCIHPDWLGGFFLQQEL